MDNITTTIFKHIAMLMWLLLALTINSCKEDMLQPHKPMITTLTLQDVAVTEAWIKVATNDAKGAVTLFRDSTTIVATLTAPVDTVVYDDGLLPNHTYTYFTKKDTALTVTTMDTTSHDFTWDMDTLGDGGQSQIFDVTKVNDTLIYVVGEIYKKDSTGQLDIHPYNAAKWNGTEWEYMRIKFRLDYGTNVIYTTSQIYSVYAISPNDIWFVHYVGGVTRYFNGSWVMMEFLLRNGPGQTYTMWGKSETDLYFAADAGKLTHYDGIAWKKLDTGIDVDFRDLIGVQDSKTNEYELLALASDYTYQRGTRILSIKNETVTEINNSGLPHECASIWKSSKHSYFIAGDGLWTVKELGANWTKVPFNALIYKTSIRGTSINNIFVVGVLGLLAHYNGVSWHQYRISPDISFGKVRTENNQIIAVGTIGNRGMVLRGEITSYSNKRK